MMFVDASVIIAIMTRRAGCRGFLLLILDAARSETGGRHSGVVDRAARIAHSPPGV